MTRRICLTGVESTGKSVLGVRLAAEVGAVFMPEYGRTYCEARGVEGLTAQDLRNIAEGHIAARAVLLADAPALMIEDTDIVMTCAWSAMLFGAVDPVLRALPADADRYLHFTADTRWIEDGTRVFGDPVERARFDRLIRAELRHRSIIPVEIGGDWEARYAALRSVSVLD